MPSSATLADAPRALTFAVALLFGVAAAGSTELGPALAAVDGRAALVAVTFDAAETASAPVPPPPPQATIAIKGTQLEASDMAIRRTERCIIGTGYDPLQERSARRARCSIGRHDTAC
jgi:hypothetical protein